MGIGSFVSKIADPVGNLINGITGVNSQTDKTYKQQINAMNAQNAYNQYMWNLQNQYNSPSAQLARMAEAGIDINPTSYALGTGNLSNTAVHVGSASGFSGNGSPAGNPISMAMGVAQGIQGIRNQKAQKELTEANIEATQLANESDRLDNEIKRGIQPFVIKQARREAKRLGSGSHQAAERVKDWTSAIGSLLGGGNQAVDIWSKLYGKKKY